MPKINFQDLLLLSNNDVNAIITSYITSESFLFAVSEYLICEEEFFLPLVKDFKVVIFDGGEKEEQDMECWIEREMFDNTVFAEHDLLPYFFHLACHKWCEHMWKHINVAKDQFSPAELDFFEEMFNQKLMQTVAPEGYWWFVDQMTMYVHLIKDGKDQKLTPERRRLRQEIISMFRPTAGSSSKFLNLCHAMLYSTNCLQRINFASYWQRVLIIKEMDCVKRIISEVSK